MVAPKWGKSGHLRRQAGSIIGLDLGFRDGAKIRNSKLEILNKYEIQVTKFSKHKWPRLDFGEFIKISRI